MIVTFSWWWKTCVFSPGPRKQKKKQQKSIDKYRTKNNLLAFKKQSADKNNNEKFQSGTYHVSSILGP